MTTTIVQWSGVTRAVDFEVPTPPIPSDIREWEAFALALRRNPGLWACFGQYPGSVGGGRQLAYMMRVGGRSGTSRNRKCDVFLPIGHFEVQHRIVIGEQRIYIRYTGPDIPAQRTEG